MQPTGAANLQVVEISLQCTLLQRWDGIRIYYPNTKLSTEPILNVSRSANRWEGFKVLMCTLPVMCYTCPKSSFPPITSGLHHCDSCPQQSNAFISMPGE